MVLFVGFKLRSLLWNIALSVVLMFILAEAVGFKYPIAWFGAVNLITFFLMGKDKASAKSGGGRVPEATLLIMAFIGGFPGLFAGRKVFNHKTSKMAFIAPMWGVFVAQLFAGAYFFGDFSHVLGLEKKQPEKVEQTPAKNMLKPRAYPAN